MQRGRLVTVEGIDGAGKSTLCASLAQRLKATGIETQLLREPGGTAAGERIRTLLKDPTLTMTAETEALLYAAARAEIVRERIVPALESGSWVLLDRFVDSSLAYQGAARGLGIERIAEINRMATGGLEPDLTLLVKLDVATARARQGIRGEDPDRLEAETDGFFNKISDAFDRLAAQQPQRFRTLDGNLSPEQLLDEAWIRLRESLI